MGKRKNKQEGHGSKQKKSKRDAMSSASEAADAEEQSASAMPTADAIPTTPSLKNTTQFCFSKRGPRRGATFFHTPDIQDVVLYGIGFKKHRKPVFCEIANVDAIPKVAVVMLSSMTPALYARLGSNFTKCKRFLSGNSYPFLTPGKSLFVTKDVASAVLDVKLEAGERSFVEEVLPAEMLHVYSGTNPMSFALTLKDLSWHGYPLRSEWFMQEQGIFYQHDHLRDAFFCIPRRESPRTVGESSDTDDTTLSDQSSQREGAATADDDDSSASSAPLPSSSSAGAVPKIDTDVTADEPKNPLMFAIDCEMCKTEEEYALTSIAVINDKLECVYQTLVKPHDPIIDYVTQYSGITEEMLADVSTRLEDVQQKLAEIIPHDAILVGHSLENDLMALKMTHRYIIDTSVLYSEGGVKKKLRVLAKQMLQLDIQQDAGGHDATEDAIATMKLAQYFLTEGHKKTKLTPGVSLFALADVCQKKGTVVDLPVACSKHCRGEADGYPVFTDSEAVEKSIKALPSTDLLWTRLSGVRQYIVGREPLDWDTVSEDEDLKAAVSTLDAHLSSLYDALPQHTLLVVLFDHGDVRQLVKLKAEHQDDAAGYENLVKLCRTSMFFTCLKEEEE